MNFSEYREHADVIAGLTGRAKEKAVADLLQMADDIDERVCMAMMLTGKLAHIHEPYTTGIKETFIANDLALDGMNSHEAMEPIILSRASCSASRSVMYVWDILRTYLEREVRTKDAKSQIITDCLQDLPGEPQDAIFLLRLLTGKMGNGVDDKTVLYATYPNEDRSKLARLWGFNPNIGAWIAAAEIPSELESLMQGLATPGVPLEPQLCARVKDLDEIIEAHGATLVQTKLDGMRVHVHLQRGGGMRTIQFFTREQKEVTNDYPELFGQFGAFRFNGQAILDGELVALAPDGSVAPFSRLQKRLGRKTGRDAYRVGIVLYDLLCYDDADILNMTYEVRLKMLQGFKFGENVKVIETKRVLLTSALEKLLLEAHEAGEEGLVCKSPLSLPAPGMRNKDWVKVKGDYMETTEFGDSYDLIVVGAEPGRGKRHGKIGALRVAARVPDGLPVELCKVGTGFTDADLDWFTEKWSRLVDMSLVVEVKAADVSQDQDGNYSLRFPRFIRVREDKEPRSATTMAEIMEAMR
jgi:DNA ligase 1